MADTKRSPETQTSEKKPGPNDYNPVNMAGRKAGSVDEHDEQTADELAERDAGADDANVRRDHSQKGG